MEKGGVMCVNVASKWTSGGFGRQKEVHNVRERRRKMDKGSSKTLFRRVGKVRSVRERDPKMRDHNKRPLLTGLTGNEVKRHFLKMKANPCVKTGDKMKTTVVRVLNNNYY